MIVQNPAGKPVAVMQVPAQPEISAIGEPPDPILTVAEVAEELGISKSQVHKLLRGEVKNAKPLPHLRVGRRAVIPRSALEQWKRESVSDMISSQSEENAADASKGVN